MGTHTFLKCPHCQSVDHYSAFDWEFLCTHCHKPFRYNKHEQEWQFSPPLSQFQIEGSTIVKYLGNDSIVVIPEGITEIGWRAFENCATLQYLIIPPELEKIGGFAFENCTKLKYVYPNPRIKYHPNYHLSSIGWGAFKNCTSLIDFFFPHSLLDISWEAFANCKQLQGISLGSVETISKQAFENCTSLTEVYLSGPTSVSEFAFYNCIGITTVMLGGNENLQISASLSHNAFKCCHNLTTVKQTNAYKYPMPFAYKDSFSDCPKLHTALGVNLSYFSDNDVLSRHQHDEHEQIRTYRYLGLCQHCGGKFRLFSQTCRDCGKKKDY